MEAMISFVDAYREKHGVEPICLRYARSPRRPTTRMPLAAPSRKRHRRACVAMPY